MSLLQILFSPNQERRAWTAVQAAWRSILEDNVIEPAEDDREDTWPVTRRPLGTREGVALVIGVRGHAETYLDALDPLPLEGLVCEITRVRAWSSLDLRRMTTGDDTFDAVFATSSNRQATARELLGDPLRRALHAAPPSLRFRYDRGNIHVVWDAKHIAPADLVRVLDVVVATCRRTPAAPYR